MSQFIIEKAKCICLIIAILVCFSTIAQKHEKMTERIEALEAFTDANKKRNEILAISQALKDLPLLDILAISSNTSQLNIIKSEDEKLYIIAFGSSTYSGLYQLEWIVDYSNKRWLFREELPYNEVKGKPELTCNIAHSGTDLYEFTVKNGKQTVLKAIDIISKCFFEDLQTLETDAEKDSLNEVIQNRLLILWTDAELYKNTFQQLKRMKTLQSDDGKVKICTYNIEKADFKHQFYGAVIVNENGIKVNLLHDHTDKIRSPERSLLTNKKWYGALYIDLIQTENGNKTYYTLMGYKGHDEFTKTRVLDVLTVQNGRIRFGSPLFKTDRITLNRMVYKYSAGATMLMRYDKKLKMIVLDNLAPLKPMFRGVYQYYGPDFSYNAFKFSKGVWELKRDIDLRNPKQ